MELMTAPPWNLVWFSLFCLVVPFLIFRLKDGLHLWVSCGIITISFGWWVGKINGWLAIGIFVICTIASLFVFAWAMEREARKSRSGR